MPFYEYQAVCEDESCGHCRDVLEVRQSILDDELKSCPHCEFPIRKLVSLFASFVTRGREMNQYSDVRHAKYWRDRNGIRHRVTDADGYRNSPTVSRQVTATPEQIKERKKRDLEKGQKRLQKIRHGFVKKDSKRRFA